MQLRLTLPLLASLAAQTASAQVLITEVQPNPVDSADTGEWIELQNTSTAAVSLDGWTLNDYTQSTPNGEQATRWTFPALASLGAGQVVVVARQAGQFFTNTGVRATWELADGNDDSMVPNLVAAGGSSVIQLSNSSTGDAVVLRDAAGTLISAVEWGTVDRTVPGAPFTSVPASGGSLVRVNDLGSSSTDFIVTTAPNPGVGFGGAIGPVITGTRVRPPHLRYGDQVTVTADVADAEPLIDVSVNLATATASTGPAAQDYVHITITSTTVPASSLYGYTAEVGNLGPGLSFAEPATFHDRFVRLYVSAEDAAASATDPAGADESAANPRFRQRNVMPRRPSSIREVREQTAVGAAKWAGLSATVRGVALSTPDLLTPSRTDLAVVDGSGQGIRLFANDPSELDIRAGDEVEAVGTVSQFRGVTQLAGRLTLSKTGARGAVETSTLTIADLLARAEDFESRLVYLEGVGFADATTTWPASGSGGNVMIKDDTGTMALRVTSATDLFGQPAPQYGFSVRGILGQFTQANDGTEGGYQLVPRGSGDIFPNDPPPPPDGGLSAPDAGSSADAGGAVADAGARGPDAGGGAGGAADEGGCGCSTTRTPGAGLTAGLLALLGLAGLRRRR